MKSIVSFQLLNNPVSTIKPDLGFIKLFFKNNILTSKDSSNVEKNLVLDTLLTGLSISPVAVPIVATDTIIQAFGKLQGTINNLAGSSQANWNEVNPLDPSYIQNKPTIPADISDLTDTTGIIPTNTSDLTNDSGFIILGDIPAIPSDVSDLTDTTGIIPTATSDLTNNSGFIVIGDVLNTIVANDDVDDTNIAIGKILQVGADGVTHEYVDAPSGGLDKTFQTLTEDATITFDAALSVNGSVTLTASRILGNITNAVKGEIHCVKVIQGGSSSYTLTYGNQYYFSGGILPILSATVGAVDLLYFMAVSTTEFHFTNANFDVKIP